MPKGESAQNGESAKCDGIQAACDGQSAKCDGIQAVCDGHKCNDGCNGHKIQRWRICRGSRRRCPERTSRNYRDRCRDQLLGKRRAASLGHSLVPLWQHGVSRRSASRPKRRKHEMQFYNNESTVRGDRACR